MNFQKIKNIFKSNKKILYYFWFFIVVYSMTSEFTFAKELSTEVIEWINGFYQIVWWILWILTQLVWILLTPDWINWNVIWISWHIKELWVMISNIVYFIFAILIIIIAFMNIIGKWEKWELKQALPKFIIWVLIVPFSWFFIQFIISISSLLSASVLALPFNTIWTEMAWKLDQIPICTEMTIRKISEWDSNSESSQCDQKVEDQKKLSEILEWNWMYWLINVYTYWIFNVDKFEQLKTSSTNTWLIKTLLNLTIKKVAEILMIVIYLILVVSLALALFTRMMWLWLYMVFSPVFWLLFFFWKEKEWMMEWKFSITQFISLAMIPVYVSAALSFGFLFIMVAWQSLWTENATNTLIKIWSVTKWDKKMSRISLFDIKDGKNKSYTWTFNFTMEWDFTNSSWDSPSLNNIITGFQWAIWTVVLQLFWLVVLWISVITALKWSEVTKAVVEPIAAFGKSVWDLIQKSPQYAPVFGGLSAQWIKRVWSMPSQAMESKVTNNVSWIQTWINRAFWVETITEKEKQDIRNLWKDWKITWADLVKMQSQYRDWVKKFGRNNKTVQEMEGELIWAINEHWAWALETQQWIKVNAKEGWDNVDNMRAISWARNWTAANEFINARNASIVDTKISWEWEKDGFDDFDEINAWDWQIFVTPKALSARYKLIQDEENSYQWYINIKNKRDKGWVSFNINFEDTENSAPDIDHTWRDREEHIKLAKLVNNEADLQAIYQAYWFTEFTSLAKSVHSEAKLKTSS